MPSDASTSASRAESASGAAAPPPTLVRYIIVAPPRLSPQASSSASEGGFARQARASFSGAFVRPRRPRRERSAPRKHVAASAAKASAAASFSQKTTAFGPASKVYAARVRFCAALNAWTHVIARFETSFR